MIKAFLRRASARLDIFTFLRLCDLPRDWRLFFYLLGISQPCEVVIPRQ